MTFALTIKNLSVAYRDQPVLEQVQVYVPKGTLNAIVGPNGAGKSTLIKSILDLQPRLSGTVQLLGDTYARVKKKVGYVPQRSSVDWDFPASALDVVMMGIYGELGLFKWPTSKHKQQALQALETMGMQDYAKRQISQLSGGQQQRVFLARALVQQAELYFLDEPLAGVDAVTESMIINTLKQLKAQGKTIVVVHHDLHTVQQYFDHVLLLNRRVIQYGKTEDVFVPSYLEQTYGRLTVQSGEFR